MGYGPRKAIALFGVLLFLFLSSCGAARREGVNFAVQQAQLDFTVGDFQRAIDIYKGAYQKYPKDSVLLIHYVKTLEQIKSHGEKADAREDFALAGSTYEILLRNYPQFADFAHSLSFDKDFLETRIKTGRNLLIEKQAQPYLKIGDFQKAIDVYQAAYRQYPHESQLGSNYLQSLEAIKKNADQAFERKDFALAGSIYEILRRNYSHFTNMNRSLSWDRKFLDDRIQNCKKFLDENALEQYRSGNLSNATAIWKSILEFDPENAEIKKAVDTATIQLRNLEKMK